MTSESTLRVTVVLPEKRHLGKVKKTIVPCMWVRLLVKDSLTTYHVIETGPVGSSRFIQYV